jgi:hypothetical protein
MQAEAIRQAGDMSNRTRLTPLGSLALVPRPAILVVVRSIKLVGDWPCDMFAPRLARGL